MGIGGDSAGASEDADNPPDADVAYNLKNGASHLVTSTCGLGVGGMVAGESLACGAGFSVGEDVSPTKCKMNQASIHGERWWRVQTEASSQGKHEWYKLRALQPSPCTTA
jgi:hypothetical protein